jgi:hypothetical protein
MVQRLKSGSRTSMSLRYPMSTGRCLSSTLNREDRLATSPFLWEPSGVDASLILQTTVRTRVLSEWQTCLGYVRSILHLCASWSSGSSSYGKLWSGVTRNRSDFLCPRKNHIVLVDKGPLLGSHCIVDAHYSRARLASLSRWQLMARGMSL